MPAKEQVSSPSNIEKHHANDDTVSSTSSQDSPTSLIRKLYGAMLSNGTLQSSMMRINKLSKPILNKYQTVLVEGLHQVDEIRKLGEGVYTSTTERVKTWCYSITIYNHFVGLWLIKNLPFNQDQIVSHDDFLESFQALSKDLSEESRRSVEKFYKEASEHWSKMRNPSLDEIKDTCLHIAARSIAADYEVNVDSFSSILVELFNSVASSKNDILTEEAFYLTVRRRLTSEVEDEKSLRRATKEFYTYAKRFVFLEFPLTYANQDLLRVLYKFTREKLDSMAEVFLTRFDRILNLALKNFEIECEIKEEPINVLDRFNMVIFKLQTIAAHTGKQSRLAITGSSTYKTLDNRIDFDQRYKDVLLVSQYAFETLSRKFSPAVGAITYTYDKVRNEYLVTLRDVSSEVVKAQAQNLRKRYAVLKDASITLKASVLEIRINRETLEKYSGVARQQLQVLYEELKTIDSNKLKVYGNQAYQRALMVVKSRQPAAVEAEKKEKSE